jgi:hypothetical protein
MFVNMVLGCDWLNVWLDFLECKPAVSLPEINQLVRQTGFQIPLDWRP